MQRRTWIWTSNSYILWFTGILGYEIIAIVINIAAPEIFALKGYDKSVDWWALGTLLYEMLSGLVQTLLFVNKKPPFFSEDPEEMSVRILTAKLDFPDFFSPSARSLLRGVCLILLLALMI